MGEADPVMQVLIHTASPEETLALGRRIGAAVRPGDVVALVGPLGAGKTHLVKGMALGLGLSDERDVNSPTFVLINEYAARLKLHHIDAYRLNGPSPLESLGFAEICDNGGVVVVEWADRVRSIIPVDALWITIVPREEIKRDIHMAGPSSKLMPFVR